MLVKVVGTRSSRTFQCSHVQVTHLPGQAGIEVEVSQGPVLKLPVDGDAIYIMNDQGDTVDSYRWPPKGKEE